MKITVFVSGRGSNLKAILNAIARKYLDVEIIAVVSDKSDCQALETAKENSIPVFCVSKNIKAGFILFTDLTNILVEKKVDLIVLAGFLKKIPDEMVDKFENRIINIHPALLPLFGGSGMYGINVHRAVFESSAQISGASVHFVDKIYDNGKIIAQSAVDITNVKTPEEIAAKVLKIEHELLPFVIKKFSENKVLVKENRVYIEE